MAAQKSIIPVAMDTDLVDKIDHYRRIIEGSIPSRSEAIRCLIEEGLKATLPAIPKPKKRQ